MANALWVCALRTAPLRKGRGWAAGAQAARPRGSRKTTEKANVFCNLTPSGAAGRRTSGSPAMLVRKVPRHFRRCGILPRRWENARPAGRTANSSLVTRLFVRKEGAGLYRHGSVQAENVGFRVWKVEHDLEGVRHTDFFLETLHRGGNGRVGALAFGQEPGFAVPRHQKIDFPAHGLSSETKCNFGIIAICPSCTLFLTALGRPSGAGNTPFQ